MITEPCCHLTVFCQGCQNEGCPDKIFDSFLPQYKSVLPLLPKDAAPVSSQHGGHSYTIVLADGVSKVEVLLKHRAFKPKKCSKNKPIKTGQISWRNDIVAAWEATLKACHGSD